MKRELAQCYPAVVVKPIPSADQGQSRSAAQKLDVYPSDIGRRYVSVPICTTGDFLVGKRTMDMPTSYSVSYATPYSFVSVLQSDPNAMIAVPYYRTEESVVNGKRCISVSTFYPNSVAEVTPPDFEHMWVL